MISFSRAVRLACLLLFGPYATFAEEPAQGEGGQSLDWIKSDWAVLPLGVKVAKLVTFGDQLVQFSGAFEYNFANDAVAPKWTVSVALKFLFPL
jgi:hypothetical protein